MAFTFTMNLNLLLLIAMVASNIISLYHLSSTIISPPSNHPSHPIPDHLLRQLHSLRATITRLTRLQQNPTDTKKNIIPTSKTSSKNHTIPSDLLLYSHLSPIASSCHHFPELLHKYMTYSPFSLCPSDSDLAEALILRGCHPLPRRRCFSRTPQKPISSFPKRPLFSSLPSSNVIWDKYSCKSFDCFNRLNPNLGFDASREVSKFMSVKSEIDVTIPGFLEIAKNAKCVIRLGIDVGGGSGTFAAGMKMYNVTILTTTMNVAAPYSEAVALRGLVPLHVPLQQRLPVFDGVVDVVRCGRAVNRWIPVAMMEFLLYDVDRVLRGGGYLWVDQFFSKGVDLEMVYGPMIENLGYKKVKWATAKKMDIAGLKNGEVYLTALLQKPTSR